MTRRELAARLAQKADVSARTANRILKAFVETVTGELRRGRSVEFVGFGRFGVRRAKARTGRNMKTGRPVRVPAGRKPYFRPGKELKEAVSRR